MKPTLLTSTQLHQFETRLLARGAIGNGGQPVLRHRGTRYGCVVQHVQKHLAGLQCTKSEDRVGENMDMTMRIVRSEVMGNLRAQARSQFAQQRALLVELLLFGGFILVDIIDYCGDLSYRCLVVCLRLMWGQ